MNQTNQYQKNEQKDKLVNGVNVTKLNETMKAIKEKPQIAKFNFKAKGKWIDGAHSRTTIDEYHGAGQTFKRNQPFVFDKDEPSILLGEDKGANPVEYALAALDGCLTTTLIYHAAARGIKIDEVETSFSGDLDLHGFLGLDENVRNGYDKIKVDFKIKSDAPREKIQELIEIAKNRSPVCDIISNPTPVEVSLE